MTWANANGEIRASSSSMILSPPARSWSMIRVICTVFQTTTAFDSRLRQVALLQDRLRARSLRPFLPALLRTGLDTCRIIRLSGFLVSLALAYWHEYHHGMFGRVGYSCVCVLS